MARTRRSRRRARRRCSSRSCRRRADEGPPTPTPTRTQPHLILASGSPQRRELLGRLGVPFEVRVSGAEEIEQGPDPAAVAVENALRKARAALRAGAGEAVLGCDTIVVLDGTIYGKPADEAAARATMTALAGRTHEVISGVALLLERGGEVEERTAVARSQVSFRELEEGLLDWYVATEEWRGRSGGYAVQGATGERLALSVEGEVENVIGLPLLTVRELGRELFGD